MKPDDKKGIRGNKLRDVEGTKTVVCHREFIMGSKKDTMLATHVSRLQGMQR